METRHTSGAEVRLGSDEGPSIAQLRAGGVGVAVGCLSWGSKDVDIALEVDGRLVGGWEYLGCRRTGAAGGGEYRRCWCKGDVGRSRREQRLGASAVKIPCEIGHLGERGVGEKAGRQLHEGIGSPLERPSRALLRD